MWDKIRVIDSSDLNVQKYVFESDEVVAESVLYKYPSHDVRTVICCSTQSGCPVGCRFCGAGDNFVRSLTAEEIVSQPVRLLDDVFAKYGVEASDMGRLQIMFMSMGEPMLNKRHLEPALRELYRRYPAAALLISTSGPRVNYEWFREISKEIPTIGLQFSVHESTDEARNLLIPFERKMSLAEIAWEGEEWAIATGRRPYFNYCVHDRNDTAQDVERLVDLFVPSVWEATISVICERDETIAAANVRQRQLASDFMDMMLASGYSTRMFDPAGQDDIGGGCGQLHYVQEWMRRNEGLTHPSVGNGLPVVHTPVELTVKD